MVENAARKNHATQRDASRRGCHADDGRTCKTGLSRGTFGAHTGTLLIVLSALPRQYKTVIQDAAGDVVVSYGCRGRTHSAKFPVTKLAHS